MYRRARWPRRGTLRRLPAAAPRSRRSPRRVPLPRGRDSTASAQPPARRSGWRSALWSAPRPPCATPPGAPVPPPRPRPPVAPDPPTGTGSPPASRRNTAPPRADGSGSDRRSGTATVPPASAPARCLAGRRRRPGVAVAAPSVSSRFRWAREAHSAIPASPAARPRGLPESPPPAGPDPPNTARMPPMPRPTPPTPSAASAAALRAAAAGAASLRPRSPTPAGWCSSRRRLPFRQYPQQFRVGTQDRGGLIVQHLAVRFQRPQQPVESRVLRVRLPVNPCRLGIALALHLLRLPVGRREYLLLLPVRIGTDAQRLLLALRAVLARDAFALRPHARIHALLILFRQVQPFDAHVHHLNAVLLQRRPTRDGRQVVQQRSGFECRRIRAHQRVHIVRAQRGREPRPDNVVEPHLRRRGVANRLHEPVRVLDLPRHIVLDHHVLLIARQKLRRPRIVDAQPAVEIDRALQRPLHAEPRFRHRPHRPAELRPQHELGLAHGEKRQPGENPQRHSRRCRQIPSIWLQHRSTPLPR